MEGMFNYFIPEDADSCEHLNVFPLPKEDPLCLTHIKKIFPLPGEFHFRFKQAFEGSYVWLDVINDNDQIPDYNGIVYSKISRVQAENANKMSTNTSNDNKRGIASKAEPLVSAEIKNTNNNISHQKDLLHSESLDGKSTGQDGCNTKSLTDDLVGLLSDPISPSTIPLSPSQSTKPDNFEKAKTNDPFNLFSAATIPAPTPAAISIPIRPIASYNVNPTNNNSPYNGNNNNIQYTNTSGFPTSPVNRVPFSMAQMGTNVRVGNGTTMNTSSTMNPSNTINTSNSMSNNSMGVNISTGNNFQGLQWQGMGQTTGMGLNMSTSGNINNKSINGNNIQNNSTWSPRQTNNYK